MRTYDYISKMNPYVGGTISCGSCEFVTHDEFQSYEHWHFRKGYIPEHLDDEHMPYVMWYLAKRGYLRAPYFDWATRSVTA